MVEDEREGRGTEATMGAVPRRHVCEVCQAVVRGALPQQDATNYLMGTILGMREPTLASGDGHGAATPATASAGPLPGCPLAH